MAADPEAISGESSKKLTLYSHWISSCSQRVRIALNLKELDYEYKAVDLGEGPEGEQFNPEFVKLNPRSLVPVLVDENFVVADSFAIILYLEEKYPQHRLLPHDLQKKALNIQVASIVGSSIQPLQNPTVLNIFKEKFDDDQILAWTQHHVTKGFTALEKLLEGCAGRYATGDEILLADVFLAPQIYAGKVRFEIDMTPFPTLDRLDEVYNKIPAFQTTHPEMQPDAPFRIIIDGQQ